MKQNNDNKIEISWVDFSEISTICKKILKENNYDNPPVDIERIIEDQDISILPIPNLLWDHSIECSINGDFDRIYIDNNYYTNTKKKNRARFTLAHELGHYYLHKDIYDKAEMPSVEEYLSFQNGIEVKHLGWAEKQADYFAGCLLVPNEMLGDEIRNFMKEAGVGEITTFEEAQDLVAYLIEKFEVSGPCMQLKLEKEYPDVLSNLFKEVR